MQATDENDGHILFRQIILCATLDSIYHIPDTAADV